MSADILPLVFQGALIGLFTGMIPGMHTNLLSIILVSLLGHVQSHYLSVLLIAAASSHAFSSIIPAIFLNAPEEGTALAVLPGHRLFQKGFGLEAVRITLYGCFSGLVLTVLLSPLIIGILPHLYQIVKPRTLFFLIIITLFLVMREQGLSRSLYLSIFLLSGTLGVIALNLPMEQSLFPLLGGLFGASTIFWNLMHNKGEEHCQCSRKIFNISIRDLVLTSKISILSGLSAVLLPGIGKTQCSLIAMKLLGKRDIARQLITVGSVQASAMLLALVSLFTINRPRDGTVVIVSGLIGMDQKMLAVLVMSGLLSGSISFIFTLLISRALLPLYNKINRKLLHLAVLALLFVMVFLVTGAVGLLLFLTSIVIGILPMLLDVRRSCVLGCLVVPIIFFYLR